MADLPAGALDHARAFLAGAVEAATPRDAATVILLRDGGQGLEAYLLRRVASMSFAAGMHVFPGGSVDPRDIGQTGWAGPTPAQWAQWLGCDEDLARALVCAAVRETFEESGVLLAGPSPDEVVADTSDPSWEDDRLALVDRSLPFAELLRRRGLVLRSDLLRPWARWVTPQFEPRRFDTRFFVAALPAGQRTRDVGGEADRVVWLSVREALASYESGALPLMPPTAATLREVAPHDRVADLLAHAPQTSQIEPVMPRPVLEADQLTLVVDTPSGAVPADSARRSAPRPT